MNVLIRFKIGLACCLMVSCATVKQKPIIGVNTEVIFSDAQLSIRAIDIINPNTLAFTANNNAYGIYNLQNKSVMMENIAYQNLSLEFRAIAHTNTHTFIVSTGNPGLIFKIDNTVKQLVYSETGEGVFYDAIAFWNDLEGIAVGDGVNGCISIVITRDGGNTWHKLPCDALPKELNYESAFAASNTNIAIIGNSAWIGTALGNVYITQNKGLTWEKVKTPIVSKKDTEGIYSIAFFNAQNGFAIGGDYTNPNVNTANKIRTKNGGKSWTLVAQNQNPDYRSCVQYLPNSNGKKLVAIGFKGIDVSLDGGSSWKHISDEAFYTIRFINEKEAFAAGQGRIAKLRFH